MEKPATLTTNLRTSSSLTDVENAIVSLVEARLTRVREMKCNPFTLWFLDKKQEQSFSMFSMETNFKAQIIFGILYMILCALFILMDVLFSTSMQQAGILIALRLGFMMAPTLLFLGLRIYLRFRKISYSPYLAWTVVACIALYMIGYELYELEKRDPYLGFGCLICFFVSGGPLTSVGLMPFVPAIVSNLLAIGLYNGLESWPSWVSTEFVLTSNIVWLSVIAGGILTVIVFWCQRLKKLDETQSPLDHCLAITAKENAIWKATGVHRVIYWFLDRTLEWDFQQHCNEASLCEFYVAWKFNVSVSTRLFFLASMAFQCLMITQDVILYPNKMKELISLRLTVAVCCIAILGWTFKPVTASYYHIISSVYILVYGACTITAVLLINEKTVARHRPYYSAMLRIPFAVAFMPLVLVQIIAFECMLITDFPMDTLTGDFLFGIAIFFFGVVFAIAREISLRKSYLISKQIEIQQK